MNITGRIIEIFDTQQVSDKFKKREFVIEFAKNPKYPEMVKFELNQDKCGQVDGYQGGEEVIVDFDVGGRKWVDRQGVVKYFNSLKAWKVQRVEGANQYPTNAMDVSTKRHEGLNGGPDWANHDTQKAPPPPPSGDQDNLPF